MAGFDRFTNQVRRMLDSAREEALRCGQSAIACEHFLLALLRDGQGIAVAALSSLGHNLDRIRREVEEVSPMGPALRMEGPLPLDYHAKRALELSVEEARQFSHTYIGTEHILLGILREGESVAGQTLTRLGLSVERTRRAVYELIRVSAFEHPELALKSKMSALGLFGRDLTRLAREGKLDPVIGRQNEIERLVQILCRRRKNNPVLIGEAGVGKTAIVEGFVQAMAAGTMPEPVENRRVVMLDLSAMVAGTKYRGEFEQRLKVVIQEIIENRVIIFIDELHVLVGAGGAEGAMDASQILKPALASGEIQCIGATTMGEYRKHIEKDAALERRFQVVFVRPPTKAETVEILKGLRFKYGEHHKVDITDSAVESAVRFSERYISERFLPDKAIDVLDEACAAVRVKSYKIPDGVKSLEEELNDLSEKREKAILDLDYETAINLREQEKVTRFRLEELKRAWRKNLATVTGVVSEKEVAEVVSRWTRIPLQRISEDEGRRLLRMEEEMRRQVVGQDEAISAVSRAIRRSRTGLKDHNRPIGSFLFLGPTGVGKTLLAKVLGQFLFQDEESLIQIDMSEYMERFSVSRLIGAPPGYVGYEEGGQLTERVRRRPYAVVLFDEFEKAHSDVYNLLLQVLEEGRLTDSFGRQVDFRNTVIILTSNLGSDLLGKESVVGFIPQEEAQVDYAEMQDIFKSEAERTFRPEFLNRLDEVVVFKSLSASETSAIVRLETEKVIARLKEENLNVRLNDKAYRFLEKEGFDPQMGARPLKRAISQHLEDRLSEELLTGDIHPGDEITISADANLTRLTFKVSKNVGVQFIEPEGCRV
ncbi:MAG: ATP-dependent Clp protease ATP-binding subunit [Candidatus Omnitrophota bacterium]